VLKILPEFELAGGPTQPGFGLRSLALLGISARGSDAAQPPQLEWGCSDLFSSVIPTGADHREAMICGVEGPCVYVCVGRGALRIRAFSPLCNRGRGTVEIESEQTTRKHERAAGRLCPAVEMPHSNQNRPLSTWILGMLPGGLSNKTLGKLNQLCKRGRFAPPR
jgi:hypothetical protein